MDSLKLMLRLLGIEFLEGIWNKASSKNQSNSAMRGPILTILKTICKLNSPSLPPNDLFCLFEISLGLKM